MILYTKLERIKYCIKKIRVKNNHHLTVENAGVVAAKKTEIDKEEIEKNLKALVEVLVMDMADKQAASLCEENKEMEIE